MIKKILIIGGTGLLGQQLYKDLNNKNKILATYKSNNMLSEGKFTYKYLDICSSDQVNSLVKNNWDYILHTASLGDVDYCERNKKEAWKVNVIGTENIIKACKKNKTKFVFFSTNAVYDGFKGNYNEISLPNPINFYGQTKFEAEKLIIKSGISYLILRLNTMYGWNNPYERLNPAVWIINKLKAKEPIKVVGDIYNSHLWVGFVSKVINRLFNKRIENSIFNIGGAECTNRYSFAVKIASIFNLNKELITAVSSDFFSSLAPRPKNTCFDSSKMKEILNLTPLSLEDGLAIMKDESP